MVDQGFYVSAWWDGNWKQLLQWYFDTGMTFPANDGAGDSSTPLMAAGAMPPPTDQRIQILLILQIPEYRSSAYRSTLLQMGSHPSDTNFYVFNTIVPRYYTDGLGDNGGALRLVGR